MKYIGAYISEEPSLGSVPERSHALGFTAIGFMTGPKAKWRAPDPSPGECEEFRLGMERFGYRAEQVLPHANLLINLCSPDKRKLALSRLTLCDEMRRCRLLGLTMVNFHLGSSLGKNDEETSLQLIADSINYVLEKTEGVKAVMENSAGQGSCLGWTFGQLGRILEMVDDKSRIGVCVDTCHAHAAGIDFTTPESYAKAWEEFDEKIGREYLSGMHLNDAMRPLGSRIDRHASIGQGTIGSEFFERLMADPRTDNIPLLLETPDPLLWPQEVRILYGYSIR